jgi:hypothetical protein
MASLLGQAPIQDAVQQVRRSPQSACAALDGLQGLAAKAGRVQAHMEIKMSNGRHRVKASRGADGVTTKRIRATNGSRGCKATVEDVTRPKGQHQATDNVTGNGASSRSLRGSRNGGPDCQLATFAIRTLVPGVKVSSRPPIYRSHSMIYMDTRLWLQSAIRGNKYILLYLPNDLSDLDLEDIEYIEAVIALQVVGVICKIYLMVSYQ